MTSDLTPQALTIHVLAHMDAAAEAVRDQDIEGAIACLHDAVRLSEQYPTHADAPTSELRNLLVFIRATRSLCPDEEFARA
jgi:hypothetical protein